MEYINISKLKPHPKNDFFFDDITGDAWADFLDSIREIGVIEPIVITPDCTIVSGHQRVRACKVLDIEEIKCTTRHFENDDDVLRALIETNIRQRGIGNPNPVKFGRCIRELERIYGIKQGGDHGNQYTGGKIANGDSGKSKDDLLSELGIGKDTYNRYKRLTELPEDIQSAVLDGVINQSVASRVIAKLSPEEQKQLAEQISGRDKVSTSEIQEYIDKIKFLNDEARKLRNVISEQGTENAVLKKKLEDQVAEVREVEVIPEDYEQTKADFESFKKDYQRMVKERQKAVDDLHELESRIRDMESQTGEAKAQFRLEDDSEYFAIRTYDYIKKNGGYLYLFDKINQLPDDKRDNFVKAIYALDAFAKQLIENIGGYKVE